MWDINDFYKAKKLRISYEHFKQVPNQKYFENDGWKKYFDFQCSYKKKRYKQNAIYPLKCHFKLTLTLYGSKSILY